MRRKLTEAQKRKVAAAYGWTCNHCEEILASTYHIDHIVPLWEGGADAVENCQPLCVECHAVKTQEEAIRRAERRRRVASTSSACTKARRRCPPVECTGCGVLFSPYFSHRCA